MLTHLFFLAVGIAMLNVGAHGLVQGAASLARRMGISPLLVGLTVVALGTSAPEFVVSLTAAWKGQGGMAIGNIVGSNIANLALILGISAVIAPLQVDNRILRRWMPFLLLITALLFVFLFDGHFGFAEGVVFCALAIGFIAYSIHAARKGDDSLVDPEETPSKTSNMALDLVYIVVGSLLLIFGSDLVVESGVGVMRILGVDEMIIGLTLIAIGTSLPELAASIVSVTRGQTEICVGNVIGSNIFNTLFILGGVGVVNEFTFDAGLLNIQMIILMLLTVVLFPILRSDYVVDKREGAFLLVCYTAFITLFFLLPQ